MPYRPAARRCRQRTSHTNGASARLVRIRHDAAPSRAKALSVSRRLKSDDRVYNAVLGIAYGSPRIVHCLRVAAVAARGRKGAQIGDYTSLVSEPMIHVRSRKAGEAVAV